MKTIVLGFSGGCYSGKTSTMNALKEQLSNKYDVIMHSELMRERMNVLTHERFKSIDALRDSPSDYLQVQKVIIPEKITHELLIRSSVDVSNANKTLASVELRDTIVLIDRTIADSLFYLLFYMNVSSLTKKELEDYDSLYVYVDAYAKVLFNTVYDKVFLFEPLSVERHEHDTYRPNNIGRLKYVEYKMIKMIMSTYCPKDKLVCINPNAYDKDVLADVLTEYF